MTKRRNEYVTARACARLAMEKLGLPPAPILSGPRGEPLWPDGLRGSITHCASYRAVVLARDSDVSSIGIDAEPCEPLPDGVLDAVALPEERAWLDRLGTSHPSLAWDRLLFSAKESVYKAWYPLAGRWLGFEEALVTVDPVDGTFQARLLVPGPRAGGKELTGFSGRWLAEDGLVLTSIVVRP